MLHIRVLPMYSAVWSEYTMSCQYSVFSHSLSTDIGKLGIGGVNPAEWCKTYALVNPSFCNTS